MKRFIVAALMAVTGIAPAQNLSLPEPMKLAPLAGQNQMDAAETPMLAQTPDGGDFRTWYVSQKRPALAVYFNRELDQMPPGWEGRSRLLIEDTIVTGKEVDARTITVGVQQNTQRQSRARSQLVKLFEQSLSAELKKQNVRLVDSTVLHRKLAASNRGRSTDIEYDSLSGTARFVLEVEIVCLNGQCEAVANLKDVRNGYVPATIRQTIESLNNSGEIDQVSRALVKRLMQTKMA